ncbi:hypothetical protein [Halorubrum salinum]|uniref:hypothetical protein n=1 Tax=Halorubrum salinum TaxID=767517 RepID=UPI0021132EEC|nr:hypothetical protein [Halorubrum salinum]
MSESEPWTDQEWEEMSAWERLTRLPQEFERRSGRLDGDELTDAGEGSTIDVDTGNVLGVVPLFDATGAGVDADPTETPDLGGLTFTEWHADNREEAADAAADAGLSLLDRIWEIVPLWAWGLGAVVLAGVAYTYLRPAITAVQGVVPG